MDKDEIIKYYSTPESTHRKLLRAAQTRDVGQMIVLIDELEKQHRAELESLREEIKEKLVRAYGRGHEDGISYAVSREEIHAKNKIQGILKGFLLGPVRTDPKKGNDYKESAYEQGLMKGKNEIIMEIRRKVMSEALKLDKNKGITIL